MRMKCTAPHKKTSWGNEHVKEKTWRTHDPHLEPEWSPWNSAIHCSKVLSSITDAIRFYTTFYTLPQARFSTTPETYHGRNTEMNALELSWTLLNSMITCLDHRFELSYVVSSLKPHHLHTEFHRPNYHLPKSMSCINHNHMQRQTNVHIAKDNLHNS